MLDLVSATKHLQTETIRTAISDHFTRLLEILLIEIKNEQENYLELEVKEWTVTRKRMSK